MTVFAQLILILFITVLKLSLQLSVYAYQAREGEKERNEKSTTRIGISLIQLLGMSIMKTGGVWISYVCLSLQQVTNDLWTGHPYFNPHLRPFAWRHLGSTARVNFQIELQDGLS